MLKRLQNIINYERIHKNAALLWIPVAFYYLRFIRRPDGMTDYPLAAECMMNGEVLATCAPAWTYPPAFAFIMVPFTLFPMWIKNVLWYAVTILTIYYGLKLCEKIVSKTFAANFNAKELFWFRAITFLLSVKFLLSVLENQAYDFLIFSLLVLGVHGLMEKNNIRAAIGISLAAALKATPLLFFPYLIYKQKWKVFALCAAFLLFFSYLPDFFFTQKNIRSGYFVTWVKDVASPSISNPDNPNKSLFGKESNPLNQSLKSFIYRISDGIDLSRYSRIMLLTAYVSLLFAICYVLKKSSKLENPYILDSSVLVVGMLMFSPMSSKSHFVVLIIPNMVIAAYMVRRQCFNSLIGYLTLLSFALSTLTSKGFVGRKMGTALLNMGCVTVSALLLLVITTVIISKMRSAPP